MYKAKCKTIPELKDVVNEFAASISEKTVRDSCQNIRKRAELCIAEGGKHFEHKLKKKRTPQNDSDSD